MSNQFVPRGQWIFGASASYSTHTNKDYTFLVIEDINSDGYTFKVTPLIAYAIRDNMAIGVKFIYSRSLLRIDSGSIKLGSDIDLGVDFYNALQHNYSGAFIWRQYIPLGQNKRFALFNEMSLTLGGGQSRFAADSPIRGTYETNFSASIGISPGLVAFATNNVAFEVNVGVMGLSYTRTRQVHNQVTVGKRTSSLMNFKVNILSIGLDSRRNGFHAPSPGTDIPGGNSVFPLAGQPLRHSGSDDRPCHRGTSGPDVLRRSERLVRIDADLGFPGTSETTIPADETENRP